MFRSGRTAEIVPDGAYFLPVMPGSAMAALILTVNGIRRRVEAPPDESLLSVLRNRLDLTGTKYGCGEGQCGACTVLLDGSTVRSCRTPVADAAGRSITTIEGLERNGRLHPVQAAFLEEEAFQCGFCTPGMILAAVGLLQKNGRAADADVAGALAANVCRCGTYPRILAAVRKAGEAIRKGSAG
jgi:aerobic-type carbon monoxide dehydrogenase small subunit (CoxS/CutS family)